jgi:hypothetical protein
MLGVVRIWGISRHRFRLTRTIQEASVCNPFATLLGAWAFAENRKRLRLNQVLEK